MKPSAHLGSGAAAGCGDLPTAGAREAMTSLMQYRTRAPKGVFVYRSHEEANRDREKWLVEAMLAVDR